MFSTSPQIRRRYASLPLVLLLLLAPTLACQGEPPADRQAAALRTRATLTVTPDPVPGRQPIHLAGCGYVPALDISGEDRGPTGVEHWWAVVDAAGCFAVDRPASSVAGSHTLRAYQRLKRGQATLMAQASLTVTPPPLGLVEERYFFRWDASKACVSEDDTLDWSAAGALAPGASFTFTPRYPDCENARAVMVKLAAGAGASLRLATVVPADDGLSNELGQRGTPLVTETVGGTARLCMFPNTTFTAPAGYTITVTNLGTTTADVSLTGKDYNDWLYFYWRECLETDADGDGWSDSYEHAMAQLVYPTGNFNDGALPAGTDYLRACGTAAAYDEFDAWPPDLDDDGAVTPADADLLAAHLGEGNGVPWASISPNPGRPEFFWNHVGGWNRFDLDADGWVDLRDLEVVQGFMGARCGQ